MKIALLAVIAISGCANTELIGAWQTEQASGGVATRLSFRSDGWVVHKELDAATDEMIEQVRFRYRIEGDKLRQQSKDGASDSATDFAFAGDRLTLVAFRAVGAHDGMVGRWRFEREAWAAPGTPARTERWEMAFDAIGTAGLSEHYDSEPRALSLGSWRAGERDHSFMIEVDGDDQEYLLMGEVLTPANAIFRRD